MSFVGSGQGIAAIAGFGVAATTGLYNHYNYNDIFANTGLEKYYQLTYEKKAVGKSLTFECINRCVRGIKYCAAHTEVHETFENDLQSGTSSESIEPQDPVK